MLRKHFYTLVRHMKTGVAHYTMLPENPTPREIKLAGEPITEPRHHLKKGRISTKVRRRGVWEYSEDERYIYFTCPWCGRVGVTSGAMADRPYYDSIWCGNPHNSESKGCHRHLSLYYSSKKIKLLEPFQFS